MRLVVLGCGIALGLTGLTIARGSVPPLHSRVTDDTAIYQKLSEINAPRAVKPNFDDDIQQLARMENRYQENLPSLAKNPRLAGPMKRVSQRRYQYGGTAAAVRQ